MAEEEVNYASVVFKNKKSSSPEDKNEEETVYDEVNVQNETTTQTGDTNISAGFMPEKKANNRRCQCQQLSCCFGILCVILLLSLVAVGVYVMTNHKSERNQLKENQKSLQAANHNLTDLNNKLSSENENLGRDHNNLTVQFDSLTQSFAALESKITNLTVENQKLKRQNQELETQNNNLTEKFKDMETNWSELNVSRAQWSIDAYCPLKDTRRQCKSCQEGWRLSQSSCYAINNAKPREQKSWDEAQEDCRRKNSDLVVIATEEEKRVISSSSWKKSGIKGYWIGLRVQDKKWQWIDGRDLTESSWIKELPIDGHCAISVENEGLKSVNCGEKNAWICKKSPLSV